MIWLSIALVALGLVWIGAFLAAHAKAARQAKAAQAWPVAPGQILVAHVGQEESSDSEGNVTTWYFPVLRYSYAVGGRSYEGTRLRFGSIRSADFKKAEALVAAYSVGAKPDVRYDPERPGESVLETVQPSPAYLWASTLGLLFVGLGIWAAA